MYESFFVVDDGGGDSDWLVVFIFNFFANKTKIKPKTK